jgi:Uma2 family endonuclease
MRSSTLPPLTIADIESMPDDGIRYEVIDGELFVSSASNLHHQSVLTNILLAIADYLRQNPIGKAFPGAGVTFDESSGVIPDLVFLTHERRRKIAAAGRLQGAPEIAIEILSPGASNERRDRHVKRDLYSARGLEEYWIVDPEDRSVEVYRRGPDGLGFVSNLRGGDSLTSDVLPGFSTAVEAFFAE